ncbi:hypothetical protein K788_0002325 [Paraburkholderia caribensis MBA4]|uniref:Uncharacterized protein n=1 Tax=Paraburkholderia caribensis MBA4 TaxID=1323664 RepID=A0A0P0R9C6_9BURK|nr:hypothetical protein K788_0002325 [Paraburkholderia caribensis MBA4]
MAQPGGAQRHATVCDGKRRHPPGAAHGVVLRRMPPAIAAPAATVQPPTAA